MTQKLKIKIKDDVEERRRLSLAEKTIFYVSECEELKFQSFQNEAKQYLNDVGFFRYEIDQTGSYGTFKKETIRDATWDECFAYLLLYGYENCSESFKCSSERVYQKAKEILTGKEIILELEEK